MYGEFEPIKTFEVACFIYPIKELYVFFVFICIDTFYKSQSKSRENYFYHANCFLGDKEEKYY